VNQPRLLCVSFYFPPLAGPRAVQVSRLLCALDARVTVVAGRTADEACDTSIAPDAEQHLGAVIRIPFSRSPVMRRLDYLARRAGLAWGNVPDEKRAWALRACAFMLEHSNAAPDALITFGQPMSDHLFGLEFKKQKGAPWIAHFSDPWADSPYRSHTPAAARANAQLEARVAAAADALVFTSQETVDLVMRKYGPDIRRKAHVLPHCYDAALFQSLAPDRDPAPGAYVIRSLGSFYGSRSPEPFYAALERVAHSDPELLNGVSVEFYGYTEARLRGLVEKYPAAKNSITFKGAVPYMESLRLTRGADCLLVVDAPSDTSVFFPSKLVDYLGSGRHICAVTPEGATRRIAAAAGATLAPIADPDAAANALRDLLISKPRALTGSCGQYRSQAVAAQMMDIVSGIMK
jgi:hypothetical protein